MPRRSTAKSLEGEMAKEEAYKVLQVAPSADDEIITQAYWFLARKYQSKARNDKKARQQLDELNQAFVVLLPGAQENVGPMAYAGPRQADAPSFADIGAGIRQLVEQVLSRWGGRGPEIIVLTFTIGWLGVLAIGAGASALWTILALAIAGVTVWAPWHRT
ncbi:MAG: J domain-containing protein [Dehalococcoidia bacterium]